MNKNLIKIYETDASQLKGKALDVVTPKTILEVRNIVAKSRRIVPRGGGTGLAGGCIPQNGSDVILDLSKLDGIGSLDKERKTIEVEAGVILDELQAHLARHRLEFPVNPSSHAIATIGGMIATDAVGSRAIKYGKTSNWVNWVEIVDSYGNLHRKGVTELSDYSGMEGITGVIVRACLKLAPVRKRSASLVKVDSFDEVVAIVHKLKRDSSVSMVEFLGKQVSGMLGLFESSDSEEINEAYHLIIEYEDDSGMLNGKEYAELFEMRDKIGPMLSGGGYSRLEDPKVLLDKSGKLVSWLEERNIPVFGHIGVGIFHPRFNHDQEKHIPEMIKLVKKLSGQISGEHGIGILKRKFVEINDQKILRNVKKRTDPENKFNVGKVI
jgi:glycolate oxidase